MEQIQFKFYNEVHPDLKPYIRHYWVSTGTLQKTERLKILPMDHVDLVFVLEGCFCHKYPDREETIKKGDIYFHGIRDVSVELFRHAYVKMIGITFEPWGLYSLMRTDLSQFKNCFVQMEHVNVHLYNEMIRAVNQAIKSNVLNSLTEPELCIQGIETVVRQHIESYSNEIEYQRACEVVAYVCENGDQTIEEIAKTLYLSKRTLERLFNRYVGVHPRGFKQIRQFEKASRQVMYNEQIKMTDVAYGSGYYDHAQFTRVFKNYTQKTPRKMRQDKEALKANIQFSDGT